ncbi:MAG: sulfatase [Phycisphaerales bacterium]|nr:MAG: sulfatase [Phycisphaerales bacterium]
MSVPRRQSLIRIAIGCLIVVPLAAGCRRSDRPDPNAAPQPNLVLITIDTQRADHLGAYGYARETSPAFDSLAAAGTLFDQAIVQWPKTNPSMASMLSSTYCITNGVRQYGAPIDPRLVTLPVIMKEAGYRCASFVANAHLGRFFNFDRGFDEVYELWSDREYAHPLGLNRVGAFDNDQIADLVAAWLAKNKRRTFFLWVHLLDPHGPYEPPAELKAPYVVDQTHQSQNVPVHPGRVPYYQRREGPAMLADYVARYDGEVRYSDTVIQRVADELKAHGLIDHTLLVITADHGESLGEHDYFFDHGLFLYQPSVRVPLLFHWPGRIAPGKRIETPVAMIDLLPTLLELLGIDSTPHRAEFQGQSFAAAFRREGLQERPIFTEGQSGQTSIRLGKWKLIDDPRPDPKTGNVRLQLYDLDADPGETENLSEQLPEIRDDLHAQLRQWHDRMMETLGRYEPQRVAPALLSPEMQELFRRRGWLAEGPRTTGSPEQGVKRLTPEQQEAVRIMMKQLRDLGYMEDLPENEAGARQEPSKPDPLLNMSLPDSQPAGATPDPAPD